MEIVPVPNLIRIVEPARHDDPQQAPKRQPPRKKVKIASGPVYTPDGHLDEEAVSKIDVVA